MRRALSGFVFIVMLSACGGGGGGSYGGGSVPPIQIANTALPFYLPLAAGNTWTFATGGRMVDAGSGTLSCTCPGAGYRTERIQLYPPGSSTVSSSFFFTKNTPSGATQLTNVVGVENGSGTGNITIVSIPQYPYGIPVMDDSPRQGESWNDGAGDSSTITSVGGTLMLSNSSKIIDVASDTISGSNLSTVTWSFAKGVGFTQIGVGTQSTNLTSFFVNTTTSYAVARQGEPVPTFHGRTGRLDAATALRPIFALR